MDYKIEQLDERTWLIEEIDPAETNVYMYLLAGSKGAVLIDAGLGGIPLAQICRERVPWLPTVVLTHGHFDHIGGTGFFDAVMLHEADREVYNEHARILRENYRSSPPAAPAAQLRYFTGEPEIDLGGRTLQLLHTPGHSRGSVCILDRERKWLFTGDTCCRDYVLLHMPGSTAVAVYAQSINRLLAAGDRYTLTWPGHHTKPVPPEVLGQFGTAAAGILSGAMNGSLTAVGGRGAKLLRYQDIGIVYNDVAGD